MKVKIEKLIFEGFGLGKEWPFDETQSASHKPIFVRKSVPGDFVEAKIIKDKKNYAEAIVEKVIEPSEYRIAPQCPYFDQCGGCEHQNISYENQLIYKNKIFRETFGRAKINKMPLPIIPGSGSPFFYRNSIRFDFVIQNHTVSFARHNQVYTDGVVEVESCLLLSKKSNEILAALQSSLSESEADLSSLWQIKMRDGKFTDQMMVEIITTEQYLPGQDLIMQTLRQFSEVKSVYHTIAENRSLKNLKRRLIFGTPIIYEKIGKYTFQISPESFFQTNSLGVVTLYDKIKELADVKMGDSILDLYCGTGTIGIYLSAMAKKVIGVEVVPQAVKDAIDNARINKIQNVEFICADAEKYLQKNNAKFDIIIVDPPRAGLTSKTISSLLNTHCSSLVYTSCNPATFARDIKIFEENGVRLEKVQPIDMFPQTHHIECVGLLKK